MSKGSRLFTGLVKGESGRGFQPQWISGKMPLPPFGWDAQ
jgi:hypothetical protein